MTEKDQNPSTGTIPASGLERKANFKLPKLPKWIYDQEGNCVFCGFSCGHTGDCKSQEYLYYDSTEQDQNSSTGITPISVSGLEKREEGFRKTNKSQLPRLPKWVYGEDGRCTFCGFSCGHTGDCESQAYLYYD